MSKGYLKDIARISQGYLNPAIYMELGYCFDVIWRITRLFWVVFWQILHDKAKITTVGIPNILNLLPTSVIYIFLRHGDENCLLNSGP